MKVGELFNIFKQNNIPNDAVLMSDSGWECCATEMDGIYYNKSTNIVVFTQDISELDDYYKSKDWILCKSEDNA